MKSDGFDRPRNGEFASFHRPLSARSIPEPDAGWPQISSFALSFDAYQLSEFSDIANLANGVADGWSDTGDLPDDLVKLRICLFFEQRRFHHFGTSPDGESLKYIRALLEAIRRTVEVHESSTEMEDEDPMSTESDVASEPPIQQQLW